MKKILAVISLVALVALSGCATTTTSGRVYGAEATLGAQSVATGKVIMIRHVLIRPRSSNTDTYVGAAVGAAAGNMLTQHSNYAVRGLGTLVGGAVGGAMMNNASNRPRQGVQIIVRLPNGRVLGVTQDDDQGIYVGQRVILVQSRDGLAVAPATGEVR